MTSKRRRSGDHGLRRRVGIRRPRKTILVFCEGERTEPEYLNAVKMLPSVRETASIDLRIEAARGRSAPRTLVSTAVAARQRAIEEDAEIDEFWCVFDVEWPRNHPYLKQAIRDATSSGIQVAVSNPCFELWLILHFQDCGPWLTSAQASRIRKQLDGSNDKGVDPNKYMEKMSEAARRAIRLDQRHKKDGTRFPQNNPSSGMHRLISTLRP